MPPDIRLYLIHQRNAVALTPVRLFTSGTMFSISCRSSLAMARCVALLAGVGCTVVSGIPAHLQRMPVLAIIGTRENGRAP